MARRRRNRSRRNNNNMRRRRNRRNISNAPPRLLLTSNTRRLVIPYIAVPSTNGSYSETLTCKRLFAYGPNLGLAVQYNECRFHSIRVYFQSDFATSADGSICLIVSDYLENVGEIKDQFQDAITYPGAMVRKAWQNISGVWFPTEPDDRNFRPVSDDRGIMTFSLRHSKSDGAFKGRLILNLSVSLRGRASFVKTKAISRCLEELHSPSGFESVDMAELKLQSSP